MPTLGIDVKREITVGTVVAVAGLFVTTIIQISAMSYYLGQTTADIAQTKQVLADRAKHVDAFIGLSADYTSFKQEINRRLRAIDDKLDWLITERRTENRTRLPDSLIQRGG